MNELEKKEKILYYEEYSRQGKQISKNYGQSFYDLFSVNLFELTDTSFHLQEVCRTHPASFEDYYTNIKRLPDSIVNLLNMEDKTVLDFGCGNGKFCNDMVEKFGASQSYGTDLATIDLGIVDQYKSEKCKFISAGAREIPLEDNSVDITTAFLVLEHVHEPNIDKMFDEFSRVTRDGFIFSISHLPANKKNLRRTSKSLDWWYRKIQTFTEEMFLYYPQSDKYKWGRVDKDLNIGYSRLICTAKK